MMRAVALVLLGALAGCAGVEPPPVPAPRPRAAAASDDGRIAALLAYHQRLVGYRTVCWDAGGHRFLRCYDI